MAATPEDEAVVRLYGVEPEEFVAERTRIVRSLKASGHDAEAARLAARRKPPLPVFAANRIARARPKEVAELVEIAGRLARAHESGDAAELRKATSELAQSVRSLVGLAADTAGLPLSELMEQRLATTLRAAALNPSAAELLRRSILAEELEPTGFEGLAGLALPKRSPAKRAAGSSRRTAPRAERVRELESELEQARGDLRRAEKARAAAERELEQARKRADGVEARLERARSSNGRVE